MVTDLLQLFCSKVYYHIERDATKKLTRCVNYFHYLMSIDFLEDLTKAIVLLSIGYNIIT